MAKRGEKPTDSAGNKTAKNADAGATDDKNKKKEDAVIEEEELDETADEELDEEEEELGDESEEDEEDEEEEESPSAKSKPKKKEEFIKMTATQLDMHVEKKVNTIQRKLNKKIESLTNELANEKKALEQYRTAEVARAKEAFDELPDEVKALVPVKVENLTKPVSFKRFNEWLPSAQALAEKLGGKPAKKVFTPATADKKDDKSQKPEGEKKTPSGNLPDPKPAGGSDAAATAAKLREAAARDPLYR